MSRLLRRSGMYTWQRSRETADGARQLLQLSDYCDTRAAYAAALLLMLLLPSAVGDAEKLFHWYKLLCVRFSAEFIPIFHAHRYRQYTYVHINKYGAREMQTFSWGKSFNDAIAKLAGVTYLSVHCVTFLLLLQDISFQTLDCYRLYIIYLLKVRQKWKLEEGYYGIFYQISHTYTLTFKQVNRCFFS